nr:RNA-directed DNA polymerase, eukaryota, reverse transcriptase zinc-binding domain protein [Tanacetum cinerariifolium]
LFGKVKEFNNFDNMRMVLGNEGFNDIDLRYMGGKRFSVRAKETMGRIPDFNEQEEDNSESEDEQSLGFIKEDFDGSDAEKEGDNNVSMVPDSVTEDANVEAEEKEDGGMFNGIKINSSMTLSHMFYADDVIFMGQWSKRNIDILMYMLKCFERASGLSINLSKSKLMWLAVSIEKVEEVTRHIGCGILNTPFSFFGSKVGGYMSRIKSWDEVIKKKMVKRLSKWKMKTLSIGGFYVGSTTYEIYPVSFFNGNDLDSKRSIWVSWNKVLTSKDKGSLGVSSLFALNRALMFKWVWRFFNQSDSLWVRVIHAIHGVDGRIGRAENVGYTSIWCDIFKEMDRLASHGIDLISMMHKKIGNMLNTSFWEDRWRGEQRLKEAFPRIYTLEVNKHISVAFKFEQTALFSSLRRMPRSGIESEQWDHLLDSLKGVMLNPSEDMWSWDLNGSGEFSVASPRRLSINEVNCVKQSISNQKMVQKYTKPGKGGRLVLFATQTLCAFFLIHLLYTELALNGTRSHRIKLDIVVTGRQVISDWMRDVNTTNKDGINGAVVKKNA